MEYYFDAKKTKNELVEWIRYWFELNGKDCNAVIGISGGKDSTVAAALCVEALGKDRVIGVLMPNGHQRDIDDSYRVVNHLGIKYIETNIQDSVNDVKNSIINAMVDGTTNMDMTITEQMTTNLPPRIRMATLYAVSQCKNGRVINTCNLSENMCSYSTLYGDHSGDVSLFDQLTVTEIIAVGKELGLPIDLVEKIPSDGLCGKTDEDSFGFTYAALDKFIRTGVCDDEKTKEAILRRYLGGKFKLDLIHFPHYDPNLPNYVTDHFEKLEW